MTPQNGTGQASRSGNLRDYLAYGLLLISSYIALSVRLCSNLLLRYFVDPALVGTIATINTATSLYTITTLGAQYRQFRTIPQQKNSETRQKLAGATLAAALFEGLFLVVPGLFLFLLYLEPIHIEYALIPILGVWWLTYKLTIVSESVYLTLNDMRNAAKSRICLAGTSLLAVLLAIFHGLPGFLIAMSGGTLLISIRHWQHLQAKLANWVAIKEALKPGQYGVLVSAEKMLLGLVIALELLILLPVAGPAAVAGYQLGILVRGALNELSGNIFWLYWGRAASEPQGSQRSQYENNTVRFALLFSTAIIGLLACWAAELLISLLLPAYLKYMSELVLIVAGAVPLSQIELDRSVLLLKGHSKAQINLAVTRLILFLSGIVMLVLLFSFEGYTTNQRFAFATLCTSNLTSIIYRSYIEISRLKTEKKNKIATINVMMLIIANGVCAFLFTILSQTY